MNTFITLCIALAVVLGISAAIVFLPGNSPAPGGGTWVPGGSSYTDTVNVEQPDTTAVSSDVQVVQQTYAATLDEDGNPDNTRLGRTAIEGEWALQIWYGDQMGGQALLRYDTASKKWVIVGEGGGAWSVEGLVDLYGVPENVAANLVAKLRQ